MPQIASRLVLMWQILCVFTQDVFSSGVVKHSGSSSMAGNKVKMEGLRLLERLTYVV